jgi:hypothetical protein
MPVLAGEEKGLRRQPHPAAGDPVDGGAVVGFATSPHRA